MATSGIATTTIVWVGVERRGSSIKESRLGLANGPIFAEVPKWKFWDIAAVKMAARDTIMHVGM